MQCLKQALPSPSSSSPVQVAFHINFLHCYPNADSNDALTADDEQTVSVAEAAQLLGRDRTRVYALLRSGDLVAAPDDEGGAGPVRILRASLARWLVPGATSGAPR